MKYKLLKDLPGLKAGEIFDWKDCIGLTYVMYPRTVWIEFASANPDFFEPIVEKKKFEDLERGDTVWWIFKNWMVMECTFEWTECKHETFLTKHDAEMERLRREARANVWLPNKWQDFWSWNFAYSEPSQLWQASMYETEFHSGNCHKTKQDAEEYGRKYAKAFEIPNE